MTEDDSVSITKTNLVAVLVPVALVVVALSAGLVVFIVRHKRLQRSFLAFANSHYNIQSGTTTFSDDLGKFSNCLKSLCQVKVVFFLGIILIMKICKSTSY